MAVKLTDSNTGIDLPLWNAQELRNEADAAVDVYSAMGFDTDETFLTSLEQEGSISLTGEVTAGRLVQHDDFSNKRREALAQWVYLFTHFVDGGQGDGYTLSRDYVGDEFNGVIESATWTVRGGEAYSAEWNLSFKPGQGSAVEGELTFPTISCPDAPFPGEVCPSGEYTIDGYTDFTVTEWQMEVSQTWEVYRRALAETVEDNDLFPETGATRRITIIADATGSEFSRESTYDDISQTLGQNEDVYVRDALTGESYSGIIASFDRTDESGITRIGEFGMEVVQGNVQ